MKLKRKELSSHEKIWRKVKCIYVTEANLKRLHFTLSDSNYMTF